MSKQATDFLVDEIRMARVQMENISTQLELLGAQKEAVQYKLEALTAKLKELGGSEEQTSTEPRHYTVKANIPPRVREAIRLALRNIPRGLTSSDIIASAPLREVSAQYKAKVPLQNRVRNELTKMRSEGQVRKKDSLYMLTEEQLAKG